MKDDVYDAIVVGGGPAGSTASLVMARGGLRVLLIERTPFPRFHVGESFLPRGYALIRELGLLDELNKVTHVPKYGAEFGFGYGGTTVRFTFDQGLAKAENATFNVERAPFDAMLLNAARNAGVEVLQGPAVRKVLNLADGDVSVQVDDTVIRGKWLMDASGQSTFLGRTLGTRHALPNHRKVAYFGHFENVQRLTGDEEGHPTVVMCDEGWFWLIPIDAQRTSIGLVMDANVVGQIGLPSQELLFWGLKRCPLLRDRTTQAKFPATTNTCADFSYYCRPYAGPGYFLLGDAAFFLDPIFSTGICLGMMGAVRAGESLIHLLRGHQASRKLGIAFRPGSPAAARRDYCRYISNSSAAFFRLVNLFYDHSFRELFMNGSGPMSVHRAVISILAGHVFPRPAFSLRWRLRLFEWMVRAHKVLPLVSRRSTHSLIAQQIGQTDSLRGADLHSGEQGCVKTEPIP
jgi:flavin-dependent dehydrogenase